MSLALNGTPQAKTGQRWTDAFLSTDTYVYTGYDQTFEQMAADTADTRTTRTVTWGPSYAAQLYPLPVGAKDPMLKSLKRVKCKPGKTVVRVTAAAWSQTRGPGARRAARQAAHPGLRRPGGARQAGHQEDRQDPHRREDQLRPPARPAERAVREGQARQDQGDPARGSAGPRWTDKGLVSDGVTLVVNDGSAAGYLQQFYRVFKGK